VLRETIIGTEGREKGGQNIREGIWPKVRTRKMFAENWRRGKGMEPGSGGRKHGPFLREREWVKGLTDTH